MVQILDTGEEGLSRWGISHTSQLPSDEYKEVKPSRGKRLK